MYLYMYIYIYIYIYAQTACATVGRGGRRHSARGSVMVTVAILAQGTCWLLHSCKPVPCPH